MAVLRGTTSRLTVRRDASATRRRRGSLMTAVVAAGLLACGLLPLTLPVAQAASSTFTVDSIGDQPDAKRDGVCATSLRTCTLRAALTEASAAAGHATINFDIAGPAPHTIQLNSKLPGLLNPDGITVDGYSAPDSAPNTDPFASNARITIEIRGTGPNGFNGFAITTPNNVIRGLAMYNFPTTIRLSTDAADNNTIVGNFLCTNAAGTFGAPGVNTHGLGVLLTGGPGGNVIGAPGEANRNVISGCWHRGVTISFYPSINNKIQNNIIGLNPSGTAALPNRSHGVDINYTGSNQIGGAGFQEGNVISGNSGSGIEVSHGRNTNSNVVEGNWFGTGVDHSSVPAYAANGQWAVRLEGPKFCGDPTRPNPDGCTDAAVVEGLPHDNVVRGNVMVGNAKGGMLIDKGQNHNVVSGNYIGVTAEGTPAGNVQNGIFLERGAFDNVIGPGNVIAYNRKGISINNAGYHPPGPAQPTFGNTITGNSVFSNAGLGIDLAPFGSPDTLPDVQDGIVRPTISSTSPTSVSGSTCSACRVEVFVADAKKGAEGMTYLTTVTADGSGKFTAAIIVAPGTPITVNATNGNGSTSEFSLGSVA
jgi:hypothetical protein